MESSGDAQIELYRAAFKLAAAIAATAGDPAATNKVYEESDTKVYDFMCKMIRYSDEQDVVGKAIWTSENGIAAPKDASIHDAGCGPGAVGKILHEHGYTNVHGSDASENYVEAAKKTGWYTDVKHIWMGTGSLDPSL